jgi:hypothetical protein
VGKGGGSGAAGSRVTGTGVCMSNGVGEFAGVKVGGNVGKGVSVGLGVRVGAGEAGGPAVGRAAADIGVQVGGTACVVVSTASIIGSAVGARLAAVGITFSGRQAIKPNKNNTINKLIILIRHLRELG